MDKRLRAILKTHNYVSGLTFPDKSYREAVIRRLRGALLEDSGKNGDITTRAVLAPSQRMKAVLVSKQHGVLAGMREILFFLNNGGGLWHGRRLFNKIQVSHPLTDGSKIMKGSILCVLEGNAIDILKVERTLLNFLQHMCGVASFSNVFVKKCEKYPVLVCSTRKTPWGLLDKRACVVGGAGTHRLNLSDALLIKDTHLDLIKHDFEPLAKLLMNARELGRFVEIEVESLRDARKAVEVLRKVQNTLHLPCFIMLDNMKPYEIGKFVRELKSGFGTEKIFLEASGGITLKNILQYAKTGVDVLSVGAITHSAPAMDISLKILREH